jgi:hypothetical protein
MVVNMKKILKNTAKKSIKKAQNGISTADKKANRVEKRAAISEAKANVKAVKKSFNKGTSAKERVSEKIINSPKRGFYDPYGGSFGFDTKLFADKTGKAVLLGSERAKTPKSKYGTKVSKK